MSGPRTSHPPALGMPSLRRLATRDGLISVASALALPAVLAGAVAIRIWAFGGVSFGWLDDDGIHPDKYGHRELAKLIFARLGIFDEHSPTCNAKSP